MLPLLIAVAQGPKFPPPTVPAGWGVNIHFTDEQKGEVAKIADAFRWVRMDFAWGGIEREKGKYDFAAYDRLLASLDRAKVRPYFILDYGNDLYDKDSPRTPEGRAAFCRWVEATMARYRGRRIVWEMWNEPNIGFWKPKPNVDEYILLAREVGQTIRRVAPWETYIGPATSGFDWPFLQRCLDAGLLKYWDAVSVHPYRQNEPESVVDDWLRLRAMIDRAAPGRNVPMISGEWGYSELFQDQTKERQGQFIVRQYLANLSCGVPISIFYDWKDDGTDPKEAEHHFGTVLPDLTPKPAYAEAARFGRELAGFSYVTRIYTGDGRQWLLLFRRGKEARIAAWTTGRPSVAMLPDRAAPLGPQPKVLNGPGLAPLLAWRPMPWYLMIDSIEDASKAAIGQGISSAAIGDLEDIPGYVQGILKAPTGTLLQQTHIVLRRPIRFSVFPGRKEGFVARLENPYGRDLKGAVYEIDGKKTPARLGDTSVPEGAKAVDLHVGQNVARRMVYRIEPLSLDGAEAVAEGDGKVRAAVSAAATDEGTRLAYDFDAGWRFVELRVKPRPLARKPSQLGMWVLGNGSGDLLRMRYQDATGQTFQPDAGPIDWQGWRYVAFPFDGSGGHWGGANDGRVHLPIQITTPALVDMPGGRGGKGTVTFARPTLGY